MSLVKILIKIGASDNVQKSFKDASINSVMDFFRCKSNEIMNKTMISAQELHLIEQALYSEYASEPVNGTTLFHESLRLTKILSTGCGSLDDLLQGGLRTGEMLEVFGPPASGKTQVAFQISVATAKAGINVFYVDTASSFSVERCLQMMEFDETHQDVHEILSRIQCVKVFEVFALLCELEKMKENLVSEIDPFCLYLKLIIIDSIASVVTPILGGKQHQGHAIMSEIGLLLKYIASEYGIAVLVINNAVSNFGENNHHSLDKYKPALGKSWLHVPHIRLFLQQSDKENKERIAVIHKHGRMAMGFSTSFYIGYCGLSSVPSGSV